MKLSEVDGEEYLSFLPGLFLIYILFYANDAKVDWHDVCVCTLEMHVVPSEWLQADLRRGYKHSAYFWASSWVSKFRIYFLNEDHSERIHATHYSTSVPSKFAKTRSPCGAVPEPPELTASFQGEREDDSCFKVGGQWWFGPVTTRHADRQRWNVSAE